MPPRLQPSEDVDMTPRPDIEEVARSANDDKKLQAIARPQRQRWKEPRAAAYGEEDYSSALGANRNRGASTPNGGSLTALGGSLRRAKTGISSVKDSDVIRRASGLGNMQSFVGSVDGDSGLDESSSYRPTRGQFGGKLMKSDLSPSDANTPLPAVRPDSSATPE
ncbi:hypothetical protein PG996_004175 [Apiospora saccharicola]|uniref:Uncharacterized protein n=1 Tax=Apiospora saccharicola TaxID=335842 RepID=A0ABR1W687_9PEZI